LSLMPSAKEKRKCMVSAPKKPEKVKCRPGRFLPSKPRPCSSVSSSRQRTRLPNVTHLRTSLIPSRRPRHTTLSPAVIPSQKNKKVERKIAPLPRRTVSQPAVDRYGSASGISHRTASALCQSVPNPPTTQSSSTS
jgi:hypothetical protein